MKLKDYVLVVDDALDKQTCTRLINLYDTTAIDKKVRVDNNKSPNYTSFNFTSHRALDTSLHRECELSVLNAVKKYKSVVSNTEWFPIKYGFEHFRIKHYHNDDTDMFNTHVDSSSFSSSKRFLLFFWYLNDVKEGGETVLDNLGISITPKAGRMVMFPPFWMFPHSGLKPISNSKYLLSTYLNYIESDGSAGISV